MEKKYRLRPELRQYFTLSFKNKEMEKSYWVDGGVSLEALEEVPSRIELEFCGEISTGEPPYLVKKASGEPKPFTDQEKDICEKAINGELLDLDSIDDKDFYEWYVQANLSIYYNLSCEFRGLKAVLTEYLKQNK